MLRIILCTIHTSIVSLCLQATFDCLMKTYGFLTPDLWKETRFSRSPFQEYTDFLAKPTKSVLIEDVERLEGVA